MLDALVSEGPYKDWPLCAAIALGEGRTSPAAAKAAMIAEYERRKGDLDKAIEVAKALPDQIILS